MAETFLCSSASSVIIGLQASSGSTQRRRMLNSWVATGGVRMWSEVCQRKPLVFGMSLITGGEGCINSSKSDDQGASEANESIPSWANLESDAPLPWERGGQKGQPTNANFEAPFYVYLMGSAIAAIAAIGSVFEYINQKPAFGVVNSDSIFYTPLLGSFVLAGVPLCAFLWFKSVQVANKEAEEQDRRDGYL